MHPDLSPHLHSPECNKLINALKECHEQNKFGKFLGFCNDANSLMLKCLRQEREQNRKKNQDKAKARQEKVRVTTSVPDSNTTSP